MEVLLYVLLAIHLADGGLGHYMIPVVETVMLDIMTKGGHNEWQIVQVIELGVLHQILGLQNKSDMLSNIRTVQVIMVLDGSFIFIVNLSNKLQKFMVINCLKQVVMF